VSTPRGVPRPRGSVASTREVVVPIWYYRRRLMLATQEEG
jgi:hypothetical protein